MSSLPWHYKGTEFSIEYSYTNGEVDIISITDVYGREYPEMVKEIYDNFTTTVLSETEDYSYD